MAALCNVRLGFVAGFGQERTFAAAAECVHAERH